MSLGDVKKMSQKDVEKYYVRYQAVLGKHVTGELTESVIDVTSKATSYVLTIDDTDELSKELHNNDAVMRELSALVGYLALNGGRFVALAIAIFIIAKHVKLGENQKKPKETQVSEEPTEQTLEHA